MVKSKISIIVPVYKVEKYLVRCIDSILNQTYKDFELILVDDGSPDNCGAICDEYAKKDNRIIVIHKENGGLMSAWMAGVKKVTGDYIGFVDSDDYVELDMFEKLYQKAKEYNADIVMCKCFYEQVKDGQIISQNEQNNGIVEGFYKGDNLDKIRLNILPKTAEHYISPSRCNKIIKKEILLQNIKYCDTFISSGEDVNIIVPCFFSAKSFYYIDQAKYHYVKNLASISNKYNPTLKEQYKKLINNLTIARKDYNILINGDIWEQMINSYGIMLLRMTLNSSLNKKEKKKALAELYNDNLFLTAVKNTSSKKCNKWEKAYLKTMLKKCAYPFKYLLFLSKIKNLLRK